MINTFVCCSVFSCANTFTVTNKWRVESSELLWLGCQNKVRLHGRFSSCHSHHFSLRKVKTCEVFSAKQSFQCTCPGFVFCGGCCWEKGKCYTFTTLHHVFTPKYLICLLRMALLISLVLYIFIRHKHAAQRTWRRWLILMIMHVPAEQMETVETHYHWVWWTWLTQNTSCSLLCSANLYPVRIKSVVVIKRT